jgi:16S rRNA (uracil1498-N3)-methyltransferase
MSDRFYINSPLGPGEVTLEGAEAHHLVSVSRLRPGDVVCLFNGDGHEYAATVVAAERRHVVLHVTEMATPLRELPYPLEVAAPLPKGDRAQFLVEKLTELGVTSFVPLATRRSVIRPREAKLEKLERYAIEASKQCGRNMLMRVAPLAEWATYCVSARPGAARILAHPDKREQPGDSPDALAAPAFELCLAVGPEGGFTEEEVDAARQAGWRFVGLGPRILRVETAALLLVAWAIRNQAGPAASS